MVCHCLLVETADRLVLVDTGLGTGDLEDPHRLGRPFRGIIRPRLDWAEPAVAQVKALGHDPADVRDVVLTHLDLDHAGGLSDFPGAEVHVFALDHEAAMRPTLRERPRYVPAHWEHDLRWVTHDVGGDEWKGFESVRVLSGNDPEILMIPLPGHSRGHAGIALRRPDGWLLHCGDAYFHRAEMGISPHCPPALRLFQTLIQHDGAARRANQERLRELARREGEVELFCSHDAVELDRARASTAG